MKQGWWGFVIVALASLAGCGDYAHLPPPRAAAAPKSSSALDLLKWSMDRHKDLASFSATCAWTISPGGPAATTYTRTLKFRAPNKFHFVSSQALIGYAITSTCDGAHVYEATAAGSTSQPASASIAQADSMGMKNPMLCGTLLHKFFGGSAELDELLDKKHDGVRFGKSLPDRGGEPVAEVTFYEAKTFGSSRVVIGKATGKVYSISYDSKPFLEMEKQRGMASFSRQTIEAYSNIAFDPKIPDSAFQIDPKQLAAAQDASAWASSAMHTETTPEGLALGTVAPDFTVASSASGQPVSLASLKGKYVLLDFWATWCPSCKETLPHTEAIYKSFAGRNLQVMAISDEDAATVEKFWKKAGLTMPHFLDKGQSAIEAYKVDGIPCLVLIDPNGKIASYTVGPKTEADIRATLTGAGFK